MKLLKKISLVYALQVFAVVLLFSYAGSSSGKKTNGSVTNAVLPLKINKDSTLTEATNELWKINAGTTK